MNTQQEVFSQEFCLNEGKIGGIYETDNNFVELIHSKKCSVRNFV